ncbi:UNC-like C-terminal-domain-containing protein [Alternaria rosae]|uniref:UNC-like C-terminal-domain-containing protein n=2 Tax=Alternaria rosae TaxID=1187941 RepID=UPI001E8DE037|nr:UNC-like C-terminal-domain-containing protein [Alternaria rosae]KAH6848502.1 UNC-like C-terminal-domain-containing protein [Alternaria rosae]
MLTTGTPLRNWALFLLLCSAPASTLAEAANEAPTVESSATAHSGATTQHTSTPAPSPTSSSSPSPSSVRRYTKSQSTCPYRTINYITHTLPQQCAKTSWSAPPEAGATNGTGAEEGALAGLQTPIPGLDGGLEGIAGGDKSTTPAVAPQADPTGASSTASSSDTAGTEPELDLEADSPFDNANFLSFDEWKKRNLAKVGQSPENVGQGRAAGTDQAARRRPVNVNALDSLGDEGEISIDFSGFGSPDDENVANNFQHGKQSADASKAAGGEGKVAPSSWALSKDAGKTCKERFNYASFDCAATVLKTNKQAKSSSSILVENKDSYMLNICSADNKFLIVELCDDILVDTIVLANYEFFSSMFRHFRVSVSDRYPVKMEKWRTLGTFEARNSRDIQPFLITEPQIWARYLRVEFLTQFGNEYYCPLSVLRVHGTTMMEQFRQEEEEARGIEDDENLEAEGVEVKKAAEDSGPLPPEEIPIEAVKDLSTSSDASAANEVAQRDVSPEVKTESPRNDVPYGRPPSPTDMAEPVVDKPQHQPVSNLTSISSSSVIGDQQITNENSTASGETKSSAAPSPSPTDATPQVQSPTSDASAINSSSSMSRVDSATTQTTNATGSSSSVPSAKASNNSTVASPPSQGRGSSTQPNAPAPSTQESFFKSIHKRLQYLEANSTLSLQYIEEQSRALRDAFVKVEKRQLAKTEKFLDHLNSTVMLELKSFRNMYDQLWQSTVIEIESMKERQQSEIGEIGTRLSLMADELVWQKRMAVVQSTLLLLCLGLVLFVRSGTLGSTADVPIVQQLGSKYTSFFESSPPRSPPDTSGMARQRRTFRNMWKSDASAHLSDHHNDSDGGGQHNLSDAETDGLRSPVQIEYSPPTPTTPTIHSAIHRNGDHRDEDISGPPMRVNGLHNNHDNPEHDDRKENIPPTPSSAVSNAEDQAARIQVLETQSGPATPNGTRDSRPSWEEVDRAMDLLKAEEAGQHGSAQGRGKVEELVSRGSLDSPRSSGSIDSPGSPGSLRSPGSPGKKRKKKGGGNGNAHGGGGGLGNGGASGGQGKKKRSPLRRSHSNFDGGGGSGE